MAQKWYRFSVVNLSVSLMCTTQIFFLYMRKRSKEEDLVLNNVNTDLDWLGVDILSLRNYYWQMFCFNSIHVLYTK